MVDLEVVIGTLNKGTKKRLMQNRKVKSERRLVRDYESNGGLRDLVGELKHAELRKSLAVLDKSELQAVVYGALAFDSKVSIFFPRDDNKGKLRKLGRIMQLLCGWSTDRFQQVTFDALIEMLNRAGVDVEERDLKQLKKMDGTNAADRKVRLKRIFAG